MLVSNVQICDERRSPHGERGLKYPIYRKMTIERGGRSPHGERGLKSPSLGALNHSQMSLPTRGAWIEMPPRFQPSLVAAVAPHTGSVD